jgi:alpha-glucosidase
VMRESSHTGLPAMRPLMLEFPDDPATHGLDDQYMFGSDILVAPVLRESVTTRSVYLPKGEWFDFGTGERYEGGRGHTLSVTIASLPVFVRAGAFLFRQPVVQHTGQMSGLPLTVEVYPAARSEGWLYEDDGHSLAYQRGESARRRFVQSRSTSGSSANQIQVEVGAPEGSYRPPARSLLIAVLTGEPKGVNADATALTRYQPAELEKQSTGWTRDDRGFVVVKMPDRFAATTVVIH